MLTLNPLTGFGAGAAGVAVLAGQLWVNGEGREGRKGDGGTTDNSSPIQVGALEDWAVISAGNNGSAAVKIDGTLWAWGRPDEGQVGNGTTSPDVLSPIQIGTDTDWVTVGSGVSSVYAIKADGRLYAFGLNTTGELGLGDTSNRSSPVQVGSDTDWAKIWAGRNTVAIVKTDGTIWVWGLNTDGLLGLGDTTNRSSPTQLGSDTDWDSATLAWSAISFHILKGDGTLWGTGQNGKGQLGLGDTANRSSPTQVGALTTWAYMQASQQTTMACLTNGTMFTWGDNANGLAGNGTTVGSNSSPIQLGALTDWIPQEGHTFNLYNPNNNSSCHWVKSDGQMWVWGLNASGNFGDGSTTNRSSPVNVADASTWFYMTVGGDTLMVLRTP